MDIFAIFVLGIFFFIVLISIVTMDTGGTPKPGSNAAVYVAKAIAEVASHHHHDHHDHYDHYDHYDRHDRHDHHNHDSDCGTDYSSDYGSNE